jgi:hypothetical protein
MKLSAVLISALVSMALASPTANKAQAPSRSPGFIDSILPLSILPDIPIKLITDLHECLSAHKTFRTNYSRADDGVFSVANVDRSCCEQARDAWEEIPEGGQYGDYVFNEPCDGATVTGVSSLHMAMIRAFFDSI